MCDRQGAVFLLYKNSIRGWERNFRSCKEWELCAIDKGGEWRNAQEAKKLLVEFLTINDTRFDGWISQDHTCCRSLERE